MANAPKCKLCGATHWANQPHAFEKVAPKPAAMAKAAPAKALAVDPRDALIAELRAENAALLPDAMAWRARKAANLARMRARRAKASGL